MKLSRSELKIVAELLVEDINRLDKDGGGWDDPIRGQMLEENLDLLSKVREMMKEV